MTTPGTEEEVKGLLYFLPKVLGVAAYFRVVNRAVPDGDVCLIHNGRIPRTIYKDFPGISGLDNMPLIHRKSEFCAFSFLLKSIMTQQRF